MNLPQFTHDPQCRLCPLWQVATNVCVPTCWYPSSLPPTPENDCLVMVGMNPGFHEDRANEPWVGPAGQLLKGVYIESLRLESLATIYLTNAARCGPDPIDTAAKAKLCFPQFTAPDLTSILRHHSGAKHRVIVLLGLVAADSFFRHYAKKSHSLDAARDRNLLPFVIDGIPCTTFTINHPSALQYDANLIYAINDQLPLLLDHLRDIVLTPTPLRIVYPPELVNECVPHPT